MELQIRQLKDCLSQARTMFDTYSESDWRSKPKPDKWSRVEILGHLIDSALHNLIRYNEIKFEELPYKIRGYQQDALVVSNQYQEADIEILMQLLFALNERILEVYGCFDDKDLKREAIFPNGDQSTLAGMMIDYVNHFELHLRQIENFGIPSCV